MHKLSICIPTYEAHGQAIELLTRNFDMLLRQNFRDFEVVISDNSQNNVVENFCKKPIYQSLNIKYVKNARKGISANTNEAIKEASGKLIKILYMDDYLADENSLADIAKNFEGHWMVTGCEHSRDDGKLVNKHLPTYNRNLYLGKNTIGSPSVLTIKNEDPLLFDENLTWVLDCDYYKRLYDRYGTPKILNKINVIIGIGRHQVTHHLKPTTKWLERWFMFRKYGLKELKIS
jgi:glycosyltransferase involved in cell wall biosynthesis